VRRRRQPLESYLILPVQRIPRYQLLLADLVKHTSPEHVDYRNLVSAQAKMAAVAAHVNEKQKVFEAMHHVLRINDLFGKQLTAGTGIKVRAHESIPLHRAHAHCSLSLPLSHTNTQQHFVRSHRRYILEGMLTDVDGNAMYCFLFNDLLVRRLLFAAPVWLLCSRRCSHGTLLHSGIDSS